MVGGFVVAVVDVTDVDVVVAAVLWVVAVLS